MRGRGLLLQGEEGYRAEGGEGPLQKSCRTQRISWLLQHPITVDLKAVRNRRRKDDNCVREITDSVTCQNLPRSITGVMRGDFPLRRPRLGTLKLLKLTKSPRLSKYEHDRSRGDQRLAFAPQTFNVSLRKPRIESSGIYIVRAVPALRTAARCSTSRPAWQAAAADVHANINPQRGQTGPGSGGGAHAGPPCTAAHLSARRERKHTKG